MKKSTSQSAFINLRVLISLFVFLAGVLLTLLGLGTFSNASAQANGNAFELEPIGRESEPSGVLTPGLGNYPNTSLLLSTDTTVTPDAVPANTTSINVFTSTNFKGLLEGNPATGVVRVTDAHPAGTYSVTVRAFDSGGASSTKTFTLIVTTPVTCNPVSFSAAANFSAGVTPISVAVGDFNGDGKQDLALPNNKEDGGTVSVLLGDGAGHFGTARSSFAGGYPQSVAVGDFNGDGRQDLAVTNTATDDVSILLGDGTGSFSRAPDVFPGSEPYSVAVGDFNGDGRQDLAVANDLSNNVSVALGDGTGRFGAVVNFGTGTLSTGVAVGDFNGDGKQDLTVSNYGTNNVSILSGDGAGRFSAAVNFGAGSGPFSVAVGDFNGDSKQDLALPNGVSNNVSSLLGIGDGTFNAATNFAIGTTPLSVAVGDFNGDGKQDLALANYNSDTVSILLGDGAGNFSAPITLLGATGPAFVAVGDFNGDARQDLAVASHDSSTVSIFLRACGTTPTPTPTPSAPPSPSPTATPTNTPTPTVTPTPTSTPPPTATPTATPVRIALNARGYKVHGANTVDLSWSGATSNQVDVYRDGVVRVRTANDGFHTDSTGSRGQTTYRYKVCEAGTLTCSNEVTVPFGR
jgi:FG-GAP-like repeat/FG-GAP repeat